MNRRKTHTWRKILASSLLAALLFSQSAVTNLAEESLFTSSSADESSSLRSGILSRPGGAFPLIAEQETETTTEDALGHTAPFPSVTQPPAKFSTGNITESVSEALLQNSAEPVPELEESEWDQVRDENESVDDSADLKENAVAMVGADLSASEAEDNPIAGILEDESLLLAEEALSDPEGDEPVPGTQMVAADPVSAYFRLVDHKDADTVLSDGTLRVEAADGTIFTPVWIAAESRYRVDGLQPGERYHVYEAAPPAGYLGALDAVIVMNAAGEAIQDQTVNRTPPYLPVRINADGTILFEDIAKDSVVRFRVYKDGQDVTKNAPVLWIETDGFDIYIDTYYEYNNEANREYYYDIEEFSTFLQDDYGLYQDNYTIHVMLNSLSEYLQFFYVDENGRLVSEDGLEYVLIDLDSEADDPGSGDVEKETCPVSIRLLDYESQEALSGYRLHLADWDRRADIYSWTSGSDANGMEIELETGKKYVVYADQPDSRYLGYPVGTNMDQGFSFILIAPAEEDEESMNEDEEDGEAEENGETDGSVSDIGTANLYVEISNLDETAIVPVYDIRKSSVLQFIPVNETTGEVLESGFVFEVTNSAGEKINLNSHYGVSWEWLEFLKGQSLTLHEVTAPKGYAVSKDRTISVGMTGAVTVDGENLSEPVIYVPYTPSDDVRAPEDLNVELSLICKLDTEDNGFVHTGLIDSISSESSSTGIEQFYAAIFDGRNLNQPLQISELFYQGTGSYLYAATFRDLEPGRTYYIAEVDQYGFIINHDGTEPRPFFYPYGDDREEVTITGASSVIRGKGPYVRENQAQVVTLFNCYNEEPEGAAGVIELKDDNPIGLKNIPLHVSHSYSGSLANTTSVGLFLDSSGHQRAEWPTVNTTFMTFAGGNSRYENAFNLTRAGGSLPVYTKEVDSSQNVFHDRLFALTFSPSIMYVNYSDSDRSLDISKEDAPAGPTATPVIQPDTPTPTTAPVIRPNTPTPTTAPVIRPSTPTPTTAPVIHPDTPTPAGGRITVTPTPGSAPAHVTPTKAPGSMTGTPAPTRPVTETPSATRTPSASGTPGASRSLTTTPAASGSSSQSGTGSSSGSSSSTRTVSAAADKSGAQLTPAAPAGTVYPPGTADPSRTGLYLMLLAAAGISAILAAVRKKGCAK